MSNNSINLVYGLDENQKLIHIGDVVRGKACGCTCPECGDPLIARKGKVMAWHFAHASGAECATAPETALHKMAKQFLLNAGAIIFPPVVVRDNDSDLYFELLSKKFLRVLKMGTENSFGNVIPDLWAQLLDHSGVFIEIKVTHGVDDEKREKLKALGVPVFEVDFSDVDRDLVPDEFTHIAANVFDRCAEWVWHPLLDQWEYASRSDRLKMIPCSFDRLLYEARCPECGGFLYVHWFVDIDNDDDRSFLIGECTVCGRVHFVSEDKCCFIHICKNERVCPKCGSAMILRHGRFGDFWGCRLYPYCDKTIPVWR